MVFWALCQELHMPHLISSSQQLIKVDKISKICQVVSGITRI